MFSSKRVYQPPHFDELSKAAKNLKSEYKNNNPSRIAWITLLIEFHQYVELHLNIHDKALHDATIGAWIFCLENTKSLILKSSFKDLLSAHLKIDTNNPIHEKDKLYYLARFNHFLEAQGDNFTFTYKEKLYQTMRLILAMECNDEKRLLQAIPLEKPMDKKMAKLHEKYLERCAPKNKTNEDRIFLAKFAVIICRLNPPKKSNKPNNFLPRSKRIKMGVLIYILQSIYDTYYARSPNNSDLYDLSDTILAKTFLKLDPLTKLHCLQTFLDYINDYKNKENIENEINKDQPSQIFIDKELSIIRQNTLYMIQKISSDSNVTLATSYSRKAGEFIGSAPGYGLGYTLGYVMSLTDPVDVFKDNISKATNHTVRVIFNSSGYLVSHGSERVMRATLERLFAKIFESLGSAIAAASLGIVSIIIFDFSYQTALRMWQLYRHLTHDKDPKEIQAEDREFIQILLDLPKEVFSDSKKEHLSDITDMKPKISELGFLSHNRPDSLIKETEPQKIVRQFVSIHPL